MIHGFFFTIDRRGFYSQVGTNRQQVYALHCETIPRSDYYRRENNNIYGARDGTAAVSTVESLVNSPTFSAIVGGRARASQIADGKTDRVVSLTYRNFERSRRGQGI